MSTIHCASCHHILSDSTYFVPQEGDSAHKRQRVAPPPSTSTSTTTPSSSTTPTASAVRPFAVASPSSPDTDELYGGLVHLSMAEGATAESPPPSLRDGAHANIDELLSQLAAQVPWVNVQCRHCHKLVGTAAWCATDDADSLRWPACRLRSDATLALTIGSRSFDPAPITRRLYQTWVDEACAATEQLDAADADVWLRIAHVVRAIRVGAAVLDHWQEVAESAVSQAARRDMQLDRFDPLPVDVAVAKDVVERNEH